MISRGRGQPLTLAPDIHSFLNCFFISLGVAVEGSSSAA